MVDALAALNISKSFDGFIALNNLDFTLQSGEVRALVGSNGAGKTTLIKILTGAHAPSTGTISINGKQLPGGDPAAHISGGISCIYQHTSLAPNLTVAENLFLGNHPTNRFGLLDKKEMKRRAQQLIKDNETDVSPNDLVADLPTVKQKEVEILKALAANSSVILMDEPTAWLSFPEVQRLHDTIRRLKKTGVTIVYISHMMDEIFRVCDNATVLRDGKLVWQGSVAETDRSSMVQHMLGDGGQDTSNERRNEVEKGQKTLKVSNLSRENLFSEANFSLYQGEILCITGLIGSKRSELLQCLFGVAQPDKGQIFLHGIPQKIDTPRLAIQLGIGLVPEDRRMQGLFLSHSIEENHVAASLGDFVNRGLFNRKRVRTRAQDTIRQLNIKPDDVKKTVGNLSGGNQQKVLLGKWLETAPDILILDEPTVGVDVGAKNDIYQVLQAFKEEGGAVLIVSSDVEEVQNIADRVLVMANGKLSASFDAQALSHEELVAKISGESVNEA